MLYNFVIRPHKTYSQELKIKSTTSITWFSGQWLLRLTHQLPLDKTTRHGPVFIPYNKAQLLCSTLFMKVMDRFVRCNVDCVK